MRYLPLLLWMLISGCARPELRPIEIGCTLPTQPFYDDTEVNIDVTKNYQLGESKKSFVGEPLINWSAVINTRSFSVEESCALKLTEDLELNQTFVEKGSVFDRLYHYEDGCSEGLRVVASSQYHRYGIITDELLNPACDEPILYLGRSIFGLDRTYPFAHLIKQKEPLFQDKIIKTTDFLGETKTETIEYNLVYLGQDRDTLRIGYREFYKGTARPAFYEELTYNLRQSRIIKFKRITIRIDEATNTFLRYTVLTDE